jgi:hypothetical protein
MNYEDDDPALLQEALDSIKAKKFKAASKKVIFFSLFSSFRSS